MQCRFNTILDSRKTGLRVKEDVRKADKRRYDRVLPDCMRSRRDPKSQGPERDSGRLSFKRNQPSLGAFILDRLFEAGRKIRDEQIILYDKLKPEYFTVDEDLLRPWKKVDQWVKDTSPVSASLAKITAHVDDHIKRWQIISKPRPQTPSSKQALSGKGGSAKQQQALYNELSQSFDNGPDLGEGSLLASFANIENGNKHHLSSSSDCIPWARC